MRRRDWGGGRRFPVINKGPPPGWMQGAPGMDKATHRLGERCVFGLTQSPASLLGYLGERMGEGAGGLSPPSSLCGRGRARATPYGASRRPSRRRSNRSGRGPSPTLTVRNPDFYRCTDLTNLRNTMNNDLISGRR